MAYSDRMKTMLKAAYHSLREPWNSLTHWAGAVFAVVALAGMLWYALARHLSVWPFVVFGLSMLFLYTASASYHSFRVGERALLRLRKLDHSAIFLLIAGSYTPVAYFGLSGLWQSVVLWVIWGVALSGILLKVLTMRLPRWVSTLLYAVMGWTAAGIPAAALAHPQRRGAVLAGGGRRHVQHRRGHLRHQALEPAPRRLRLPRNLAPVRAGRHRGTRGDDVRAALTPE